MAPYLLNVIYIALLFALSPWILYRAVRHGKYRQGCREKLFGLVPWRDEILSASGRNPVRHGSFRQAHTQRPPDREPKLVWFHAVSVGEVNLLTPLLWRLARQRPDWRCVISTTTRTGYELARKRYAEYPVFYCPLDFSWATNRAMRRLRPDLLVLAELELWPNLIRSARRHGARTAVVNARMSDHSFRGYRRIRPFVSRVLRQIESVAAQDAITARRFLELGAAETSVRVTGSLKYDGAQTDRGNPRTQRLRRLAGLRTDDVVFLAGSTQAPEEQLAMAAYQRLAIEHPQLRLILVPRHPERFDAVADMLQASGVAFVRRSQLDEADFVPSDYPSTSTRPVLLVDTIGELGAWWGAAHIGFVGGSLGSRGGQNMIEPAAYGSAVCFGPNTHNFRDIVAALLAAGAAQVVADGNEITAFLRRCLEQPLWAEAMGSRAKEFVRSQLGAAERTITQLADLLDEAPARRKPARQSPGERPAA